MAPASTASRLKPWAGWISSAVALAIAQQGLGDLIYFRCGAGAPVTVVLVAAATLAIAWLGGAISWAGRHSTAEAPEPRTRLFISVVGVMLTALYSVTIVFQVLAGLIIPVCFR